jgi:hypothetical protein
MNHTNNFPGNKGSCRFFKSVNCALSACFEYYLSGRYKIYCNPDYKEYIHQTTWSGRRDSNPLPTAWEAVALPGELLPQVAKIRNLSEKKPLFCNYLASFLRKKKKKCHKPLIANKQLCIENQSI